MNKKEALTQIQTKYGCTKKEAQTYLNITLDLISEALVTGDGTFNITGWGKFYAVEKAERKGRNPKTGESIDIAATTTVKFKVGSRLKVAVKEKTALVQ